MKKIIVLLIPLNSLLIFSQKNSLLTKNQFTESELNFIKETYKWEKEKILIIKFTQPSKNCHYNNNKSIKKYESRWDNGINLKKKKTIHIYSDQEASKDVIDNKKQFNDKDDFFYNKFFINDKYCYGVVVINKKGKYGYKSGEYSIEDIKKLIQNL